VTRIKLLSIGIDSQPDQLRLDTGSGITLRLEAGVHLDLTDTPADTCKALAELLTKAAQLKWADYLRKAA
jgi:hypothetical protein